jgi:hypothetical protein
MTLAVCFKCAKIKIGAYTPCDCGAMPRTREELSTALMLTDHFLSMAELTLISKEAAGGPPKLPDHILEKLAAAELAAAAEASAKMMGCDAPRRSWLSEKIAGFNEWLWGIRP